MSDSTPPCLGSRLVCTALKGLNTCAVFPEKGNAYFLRMKSRYMGSWRTCGTVARRAGSATSTMSSSDRTSGENQLHKPTQTGPIDDKDGEADIHICRGLDTGEDTLMKISGHAS